MIATLCLLLIGIATASAQSSVQFTTKQPVVELVGAVLSVQVEATLNGAKDARTEAFRLAPQSGLLVFADSDATLPIASGTDLATDAATGTKQVYVTSNVTGTYKLDLFAGPARTLLADTYQNLTFFKLLPVAAPVSNPAGMAFIQPLSVTLTTSTSGSSIHYTTDGSAPTPVAGGSTKLYTGPITLTATTTLKAIAVKPGSSVSDVMTEHFVYAAPPSIGNAYYQDRNGDGRIETAVLAFDRDLPFVPEKLGFRIKDQTGQDVERTATPAEIRFSPGSKNKVTVAFSQPFPYGITSVTNAATSGLTFRQENIPLLTGSFAVQDSVPPVLIKSQVLDATEENPDTRVRATLSEAVSTPIDYLSLIAFSRNGVTIDADKIKILSPAKDGDRDFTIRFESSSAYLPTASDSAALNTGGAIRDLAGNSPGRMRFIALDGILHVGLAASPARRADFGLVFGHGLLSGRWLALHPPRSIACYGLRGSLLGMARPAGSSGAWELPAGDGALYLVFRMPDGKSFGYRNGGIRD
jgi:hypothetical protein